jgi:CheY-like chemotaxis protein
VKPFDTVAHFSIMPPASGADATRLGVAELAGVLHEVSNALTVVLGWLEVAQRHVQSDEARKALDVALRQARLGQRIARRAIGAIPRNETKVGALSDVVTEAVLAVQPLAERHNVRVDVVGLPQTDVFLQTADVAAQVLVNLLLNGVAFSSDGDVVTVHCRSTAQSAFVTVSDQGPGIDPERAETLWDEPASTRPGGAGVGLTYCRALARSHGADLQLLRHSPGAAFEMSWPRAEPAQSRGSEHNIPRSLAGLRILLVEDDAAICSLVEFAFERHGSTVVSANNLADVTKTVSRGDRFDLALVDLSPLGQDVESGLRLVLERVPQMPLVLITGSTAGLPDGMQQSFAAWVRKPFEAAELISTVQRITGCQ